MYGYFYCSSRVLCVVPNKYPYFLDWMTGIEEVVVYKTDTEGRAARAVADVYKRQYQSFY